MVKKLTLIIIFLIFKNSTYAQFLWYENETNVNQIKFSNTLNGSFNTNTINPNIEGINTNSIVSQFNRENKDISTLTFSLTAPIIRLIDLTIRLNAYINLPTEDLQNPNTRIRINLTNSSVGGNIYKQTHFTIGQEWQSLTFDFNELEISQEVLDAGGYDTIIISFADSNKVLDAVTYYIDSIEGSISQSDHVASWLAGSWGVTFPVFGGERLDSEVKGGYELPKGAQEVVDELPAVGHIITNLSYFANSHYFTIRQNSNVDVVNEIHESLVPTEENEAIIYEVMQKFKDSGKKVILYISTNYLDRADEETHEAWVNYYTNKFNGDEYAAYRDLIQGFVLQVKDYTDGYWLDTTAELDDDGNMEDFVEMIREADPGVAVTAQPNGGYFTNEDGSNILVASDGLDDLDDRDYRIIDFRTVNTYQDYTSGHVTPLGQGAPPNSWAYEEFSIQAMIDNPWSQLDDNIALRHGWFPVREKWHVSKFNLIFGTEDAYRFTKRIKDAKAGITFATTIDDVGDGKGYMMDDEMIIMKEINNRLLMDIVPDFEPYTRPEGAHLVGENIDLSINTLKDLDINLYPNPVEEELTITRKSLENINIKIISTFGSVVHQTSWNDSSLIKKINLPKLNPGLYFVQLINHQKFTDTYKIIIK